MLACMLLFGLGICLFKVQLSTNSEWSAQAWRLKKRLQFSVSSSASFVAWFQGIPNQTQQAPEQHPFQCHISTQPASSSENAPFQLKNTEFSIKLKCFIGHTFILPVFALQCAHIHKKHTMFSDLILNIYFKSYS